MERATEYNNLLVNRVRSLRQSGRQFPGTVVNSSVRGNIPGTESETGIVSKGPAENTGKLEKTKLYIKNMVSIRC